MATKKAQKTEAQKYTCVSCGRTVGEREFYSSDNPKYKAYSGKLPYCKTCIKESYMESYNKTRNTKQSIISTAMRFDIPFIENNIPSYNEDEKNTSEESLSIWYEFVKLSNSVGKQLLSKNGFDYEDWVGRVLLSDKIELSDNEKMYLSNSDLDIDIDDSILAFFGEGFNRPQYQHLTRNFLSMAQAYKIDSPAQEAVFKDLAFIDLKLQEAKTNGTPEKEIIQMMDARRKLFKDASIDMKEKTGDEIDGIGVQVKRMETTRPAEILEEWDTNKLDLLSTIIAGHIQSNEGMTTELVKKYEKMVEPYGIDFEKIMGMGDDDE